VEAVEAVEAVKRTRYSMAQIPYYIVMGNHANEIAATNTVAGYRDDVAWRALSARELRSGLVS